MTQAPGSGSLSASVLAHLDDLELMARIVIEGTRTGGNRSPFHGFTTEFHQHRPRKQDGITPAPDQPPAGRSNLHFATFQARVNVAARTMDRLL